METITIEVEEKVTTKKEIQVEFPLYRKTAEIIFFRIIDKNTAIKLLPNINGIHTTKDLSSAFDEFSTECTKAEFDAVFDLVLDRINELR